MQQEDTIVRDPIIQQTQCSHKCRVKEDSLVVDQTSCIAFICKIINVTTKQEKKSDRIKTLVNAAEDFLGIKDLRAAMIHDLFITMEREKPHC